MVAVGSLLLVLLLSLIVVRVAAEALILTGMSRQAAQFQARSAWTGTGFTTAEAEQVVNHPVRRQIVSTLMFLRSVGLVTAASTLMLSFVSVEERGEGALRLVVLIGGLAGVALCLKPLDQRLDVARHRLGAQALHGPGYPQLCGSAPSGGRVRRDGAEGPGGKLARRAPLAGPAPTRQKSRSVRSGLKKPALSPQTIR